MKYFYFLLPLIACVLGCGNKGETVAPKGQAVAQQTAADDDADEQLELTLDTLRFHKQTKEMEVKLIVDFPRSGPVVLVNAIEELISEALGGTYDGPMDSGKQMLDHYGKVQIDTLRNVYRGFEFPDPPTLYYSMNIRKLHETPRYITYSTKCEDFLGGAHGMHTFSATTVRKSDGRRFGWDMLRNTDSEAFRQLIKSGLKSYFQELDIDVSTDELLAEQLAPDMVPDYLPLPKEAPYFSPRGVEFIYQPYEIAPYAVGMPAFTLSIKQIRPYLTVSAQKLLQGNN